MTSYCNFCKNKTEKEGVFICNTCQKVLDRIHENKITYKICENCGAVMNLKKENGTWMWVCFLCGNSL